MSKEKNPLVAACDKIPNSFHPIASLLIDYAAYYSRTDLIGVDYNSFAFRRSTRWLMLPDDFPNKGEATSRAQDSIFFRLYPECFPRSSEYIFAPLEKISTIINGKTETNRYKIRTTFTEAGDQIDIMREAVTHALRGDHMLNNDIFAVRNLLKPKDVQDIGLMELPREYADIITQREDVASIVLKGRQALIDLG